MKLMKCLLCLCMCCFNIIPLHAQETDSVSTEKQEDYSRLIPIFETFYQDPSTYTFQDGFGNDVTLYVLAQENLYDLNQLGTINEMMGTVVGILPAPVVSMTRSTKTVTYNDLMVSYSANYYVTYDAKLTLVISDSQNIITSDSSIQFSDMKKGNCYSYYMTSVRKSINATGSKITFTATHNVKYVSTSPVVSKDQSVVGNR